MMMEAVKALFPADQIKARLDGETDLPISVLLLLLLLLLMLLLQLHTDGLAYLGTTAAAAAAATTATH